MAKIKDVALVIALLLWFSSYWCTDGQTDRRTYGESRDKNFSDRWVTRFSKEWLMHLRRARAPLKENNDVHKQNRALTTDVVFSVRLREVWEQLSYSTGAFRTYANHIMPIVLLEKS